MRDGLEKRVLRYAGALATLFIALGCNQEPLVVRGEIASIRVVAEAVESRSGGDSGVAGALVGGLVAGPIGAVIGGLATREGALITVRGRIVDCRVIIRGSDGHEYVSHVSRYDNPAVCAGMREGDVTRLVMIPRYGIRWVWGEGAPNYAMATRVR